jgi:hypothetical protein
MSPEILIADDHSMIRKGLKLYMQVILATVILMKWEVVMN